MWIMKNAQGTIERAARCEQMDEVGVALPGQIEVPDDDPELVAYLNPPPPPPPITPAEMIDAMEQVATAAGVTAAQRKKLTALKARLS